MSFTIQNTFKTIPNAIPAIQSVVSPRCPAYNVCPNQYNKGKNRIKALSYELPRGLRINCISPGVLTESTAYHDYFPGFIPVDSRWVAIAYERSIFGVINGRIVTVY